MENKPAHHPRPEEDMSIKWFGLVALVFVSSLAVIPTAQAARPGFVFPDICCYFNDALVRTVVPPAAFPNEGLDNFYRVEGQTIFGVVAVALLQPHLHVVILVHLLVVEARDAFVPADHDPERRGDVGRIDAEVGGARAVDVDAQFGLVDLQRHVGVEKPVTMKALREAVSLSLFGHIHGLPP